MSLRRIVFTIDEARAVQIEGYARDHGYASAGDFARVATFRIMSMYPSKKPMPIMDTARGQKTAPEVPQEQQGETVETVEDRPSRAS